MIIGGNIIPSSIEAIPDWQSTPSPHGHGTPARLSSPLHTASAQSIAAFDTINKMTAPSTEPAIQNFTYVAGSRQGVIHEYEFGDYETLHSSEDAPALEMPSRQLVYPDFQVSALTRASTLVEETKAKSNMTQGSTSCRLLELPRELRDMIWKSALSQDSGKVTVHLMAPRRSTAHAFALTETCRQIQYECGDMVYSLNTFSFKTDLMNNRNVPSSWNFDNILAKQIATNKLQAVDIHVGSSTSSNFLLERWGSVQSPLRKLRKIVSRFSVTFEACLQDQINNKSFKCVLSLTTAQDAARDLEDCWKSQPKDSLPTPILFPIGVFSRVLRSFFPFWKGKITV